MPPRFLPTATRSFLTHQRLPSACRILPKRRFHPEPRTFQTSPHAAHRALYRWTAQAIGTPFLVAYLCERIANRGDDGSSSWKLDVSQIGEGLLTEPMRMAGGRPWSVMGKAVDTAVDTVKGAVRDFWRWSA